VNASPVPQVQQAVDEALTSVAGVTDEQHQIDLFTLASSGAQDLTLTYLPSDQSWNVSLNGITALWGTDYTITDATLSLLSPLDARTGDVVEVQYDYLTGLPAAPIDSGDVLFTWAFDTAPTTSGSPAWDVANGSYYTTTTSRNGPSVVGWQSDCHAHKTVAVQTRLAAAVAVRAASSTTPTTMGDDTDSDDFGLFSFCATSGSAPLFYLGWDSTFAYLKLYTGQRGTAVGTSATRMTNTVGAWDYVELEVQLGTSGYAKVWLNGAVVITYTADLSGTASLTTVKMGGFLPNLSLDDFYIATGRLGDLGDVSLL
jgi:hypothetical protein